MKEIMKNTSGYSTDVLFASCEEQNPISPHSLGYLLSVIRWKKTPARKGVRKWIWAKLKANKDLSVRVKKKRKRKGEKSLTFSLFPSKHEQNRHQEKYHGTTCQPDHYQRQPGHKNDGRPTWRKIVVHCSKLERQSSAFKEEQRVRGGETPKM